MANKKLMIDTSILIDYFRKTDKKNARLVSHFRNYEMLFISSITEFEILNGAKQVRKDFWEGMSSKFVTIDFDSKAAREAAMITEQLKAKRKTLDKPDLSIAATAITNQLHFDTLNTRHFMHIDHLMLLPEVEL